MEHCLPCYTQNLDELTRQGGGPREPGGRQRSHLSHRALIWSANLARSLLAPPSLCSMTRIRRRPALTSRWNTAWARLRAGRRSLGRRPLPAALAETDRAVGPQGPLGAVVGGAGGVAQALQGGPQRGPPPRRRRG